MLQGVYEPFHEPKLAHGSARCQPCPRIPLACLAASILAARAIICFYFIWSPIDHSCSQPHARLAARAEPHARALLEMLEVLMACVQGDEAVQREDAVRGDESTWGACDARE